MKKKLVWKIRDTKLDKKNFWIPFLVASGLSLLIYFFGMNYIFYLTIQISTGDLQPYFSDLLLNLFTLPFTIFLTSLPVFFIIKRLLSKKPKKVLYFELPILIIIYSIVYSINQVMGLMIGGPINTTLSLFWKLIIPPIIFIIVWLVLLTTSLYFYYKKKILKN